MTNLSFIQENFFDSLFFAQEVAKKLNTRVANFHDLVNIRVKQDYDQSLVWNRWFTPFTTLYLGRYNDKRLIVVAHHLGPLNSKERFMQWAESGENQEESDRKDYGSAGLPKISQQEFADLVEGKFGEVSVLDFDEYYAKHGANIQSSFIHYMSAWDDPLLNALFGPKFHDFLDKHLEISSQNAKEKNKEEGAEYKLLEIGIRDRYGWHLFGKEKVDFPDNNPVALFLTFGRPSSYGNRDLSVATEIRAHEDDGYANFVVLNDENEDILTIDYDSKKHWSKCRVENLEKVPEMLVLMGTGPKLFSQYPKEGARCDTDEPMFEVLEIKRVGEDTFFQTELYGSPFLKYDISEVMAVAPEGANAYIINGEISGRETVSVPVRFFNVKVDEKRRILRGEEVASNLKLLLKINGVKMT